MRCAVDDAECTPGRLRLGHCRLHYVRLRKRGSTSSPRLDTLSRYTVTGSGCWLWSGPLWPNGYGKTSTQVHGTRLAHRAFYIEHRGDPGPLDVDHTCRVRACVNRDHLQAVTHAENLARGHAARVTCRSGRHDITQPGALKLGTTECVACWRLRYRSAGERYRQRQRER